LNIDLFMVQHDLRSLPHMQRKDDKGEY